MKGRLPYTESLALAVAGAIIAFRGLPPGAAWDESLFPFLGAALGIYLLQPVSWISPQPRLPWRHFLPAVLVLVLGSLLGLVVLQAAGWTMAWSRWASARMDSSAVPARRLAWVLFLVFPWISHDFPWVGWFFRITGAAATAAAFELLGFPVNQEGTSLVVGGLPMEIAPACAGLGLLQATMVAGGLLLVLTYPGHLLFFWLFALLPVAAWAANTLRMIVITAAGLSAGPEFAEGLFHTWGGLAAIASMVAVCIPALWVLKKWIPDRTAP